MSAGQFPGCPMPLALTEPRHLLPSLGPGVSLGPLTTCRFLSKKSPSLPRGFGTVGPLAGMYAIPTPPAPLRAVHSFAQLVSFGDCWVPSPRCLALRVQRGTKLLSDHSVPGRSPASRPSPPSVSLD